MKTTIKHIALGTLVFLLFSQMSFTNDEVVGKYRYYDFGFKLDLKLRQNHTFQSFKVGHGSDNKKKGSWKVENENVILTFKKRYRRKSDTLKIKRLDSKIDSLGNYKKL